MKRTKIAVVLAASMSLTAFAGTLEPAVQNALRSIHTVTGHSAWDRMKSCGIKFADGSWIETADVDQPQIGARKGDLILEVYLNVPPIPGDDRSGPYTDLVARWIIRNGRPNPESAWAKEIQNKTRPLKSAAWLNC